MAGEDKADARTDAQRQQKRRAIVNEEQGPIVHIGGMVREQGIHGPRSLYAGSIWRGLVRNNGVPDPSASEISYAELRLMRWDEVVASCLMLKELLTLSHMKGYEHDDAKIRNFVGGVFEEMQGNLRSYMRSALVTAMWAGYAATEVVWKVMEDFENEGKWGIRCLRLLDPDTLQPNALDIDLYGRVQNVVQFRGMKSQTEDGRTLERVIPAWKVALYTFRAIGENPYGEKILRAARLPWLSKVFGMETWEAQIERVAIPPLVMYLEASKITDPTATYPGPDGRQHPVVDAARMWLDEVRRGSSIVTSRDPNFPAKNTIEYIESDKGMDGDQMLGFAGYNDGAMARALMVPLLTTTESRYGSKAQSETHADIASIAPEDTCQDLGLHIIESLVKPLIIVNFGKQRDYGRIGVRPFSEKDLSKLATAVSVMTTSGWVSPKVEEARAYVAQLMDIPEIAVQPEPPDPMLVTRGYQTPDGNYIPNAGQAGGSGMSANGGQIGGSSGGTSDRKPTRGGAKVGDKKQ